MKNSFGNHICVTLFGESHGPSIGAVLDGLPPGMEIDRAFIASQLALRRPEGKTGTARREEDHFSILSGVFEGYTTGTPLAIVIPNENVRSKDYSDTRYLARPGHADYTAYAKYHGFEDYRGGGHFSGRITAALTAAGAVVIPALKKKGIFLGSHILRCAGISDRPFDAYLQDVEKLNHTSFAVLDSDAASAMKDAIVKAAEEGDSVGGILETAVLGIPAGLGEPWFDSMESLLSHALFSIPAVKGVAFGDAFSMADARGSEFNDPFRMNKDQVVTASNHNGGINGGITNGMPVLFRCMVKPTPSIFKEQQTVNFRDKENAVLSLSGRHDPAIIHRARVVVDSMTALVLADILTGRFGTDYLGGKA
ncbi:MAG: chorismate synthase [Firmicutes bacterium]|nr:chorismate synthase [Bacillota bacterium]